MTKKMKDFSSRVPSSLLVSSSARSPLLMPVSMSAVALPFATARRGYHGVASLRKSAVDPPMH